MLIWIIEGLALAGVVGLVAWMHWRERHAPPPQDEPAPPTCPGGDPPGA